MNAITTVLSSVGSFSDTTKNQYSSCLALANEVLRQVNEMLSFVQSEKDKVERQLIRVEKIHEEISDKTLGYYVEMESAHSDYQYYSDKYYAAGRSSSGSSLYGSSSYSSSYSYGSSYSSSSYSSSSYSSSNSDDIAYYSEKMDEAYKEYTAARDKYDAAKPVKDKVEEQYEKIKQLNNAINAVGNALERNSFEIRKYISLIEDEASYNVQSLLALVSSIQTYVTSKEIFSTYAIDKVSDSSSASTYVSLGSKRSSSSDKEKDGPSDSSHRFKFKSAQTMEQYLTQEGQEKPIYRRFNVYAPPVKNMILQATMRMGPSFQQFILKQLEGVVFLNAQHGFTYGANNKNGTTLRIIGVNLSDPAYSRNLLRHVGHHIYLVNCTKEDVIMNNFTAREAQNNIRHANAKIQNLSREITAKAPVSRRKTTIKSTPGSKFFSSCFKAYVEQDQEFLNAVKESYGESYKVFSDIMKRMPHD